MRRNLTDILQDATIRSHHSLERHKAEAQMYKIPWLSIARHEVLPQNDSDKRFEERKQHLVKTRANGMFVAYFGYCSHDWWVTPTGQLLTPDFGHTVTHWAPLPSVPDSNTPDHLASGEAPSAPTER